MLLSHQNSLEIQKKIKYQIVSWGSTYHIIKEALEKINRDDIGFLHFSQVYPIHESTKNYLAQAKINIIVEQNPTGQFANLIENETHIHIDKKILKYSGYTLSVEDMIARITDTINGGESQ